MKSEPLSLEHQDLLRPRFNALGMCLSEYGFASLYLFRREHDYHVLFDGDLVWIRGKTRDGVLYLMPTEDIRKISSEELLDKLRQAQCFFPIPDSWVSSFDPKHFQFTFNRDESDYIFQRDQIAEYPGRNLSPKRNLLKQFLANHAPRVVPYKKELYRDALAVLDAWQMPMKGHDTDYSACKDALQLSETLELSGYLVYVDQQPAAFILGEIYRSTLFVIHFAKANIQYKGIYPFLFKELALQLSSEEICCLNWEQDLGQEGLRKSKLSYQPKKLANKYRMFPIR